MLAFGKNDYSLYPSNKIRYIKGIKGKWRIARSNKWKLIYIPHPQKNIYEFYDIKNDPLETNNLINDPSLNSEINYFKRELFKWIKKEDLQNEEEILETQIDKTLKKRLKTLGYLQ